MSISGALNNAASGLAASGRLAETISNNVANAMTAGYSRQTTELSSLSLGGLAQGVRVAGTTRAENAFLTAERRGLDASLGATSTRSDVYERMMAAMGEAGADNAVSTLATALETTLMAATASPQSTAKLTDAVNAARDLANAINSVSNENVRLRTEADAEISRQVTTVNNALKAVDDINRKIATLAPQGVDVTALQDERNRVIDGISSIIPVRTVKRENDQVALYSANGGVLLDGKAYELQFTAAANVVTSDMTVDNGSLGALKQDQGATTGPTTIATATGSGLFDGGSLAALFEVRDRIVPEFDGDLDRYANDLIERFRDLMPTAALDASGEGLFVDSGAGTMTGLAGRLEINAAVDPSAGGAVWRLRDGLSAATAGEEGNGSILQSMTDAMTEARAPTGFISQNALNGSATMASELGTFFAGRANRSDEDKAYLTARQSALAEEEGHATGVDADSELESLTLVEQTYAANARVLSVIDDLMKLLLEA